MYLLCMKLTSIINYWYLMPLHQHHIAGRSVGKNHQTGLQTGYCEVYCHAFSLVSGLLEQKFLEHSSECSWNVRSPGTKVPRSECSME